MVFQKCCMNITSANANNGSGFEGLGDNNIFWNVTTGIVLILGRYLPIIGPVAIAGLLANKKYIPESARNIKNRFSHIWCNDICSNCYCYCIVLFSAIDTRTNSRIFFTLLNLITDPCQKENVNIKLFDPAISRRIHQTIFCKTESTV